MCRDLFSGSFKFLILTLVFGFPYIVFSQDSSGPVLSAFSQNLNTVDITSGGVTLTIQITVTDSSNIASISSTPSLTLSSGSTSITSGYQNFTNWSETSANFNVPVVSKVYLIQFIVFLSLTLLTAFLLHYNLFLQLFL
tara:strand:+ start:220 stop:636 length:417 start_codon:yes stop_codon:yes gene_type:complete